MPKKLLNLDPHGDTFPLISDEAERLGIAPDVLQWLIVLHASGNPARPSSWGGLLQIEEARTALRLVPDVKNLISDLLLSDTVFFSYANEDFLAAEYLVFKLRERVREKDKFDLPCFLARKSIRSGDKWLEQIRKNVASCRVFVPLVTEHWRSSQWCNAEAGAALMLSKPTVPIRFGKKGPIADVLKSFQDEVLEDLRSVDKLVENLRNRYFAIDPGSDDEHR